MHALLQELADNILAQYAWLATTFLPIILLFILVLMFDDIKEWIGPDIDLLLYYPALAALLFWGVLTAITADSVPRLAHQWAVSPVGYVLYAVGVLLLLALFVLAFNKVARACHDFKVLACNKLEAAARKKIASYQETVRQGRESLESAKEPLLLMAQVFSVFLAFAVNAVLPKWLIFTGIVAQVALYMKRGSPGNRWKFYALNVLVGVSCLVFIIQQEMAKQGLSLERR